jgi:hypothetical protein
VTQICKLLGKSDEAIQKKLQGHLSMDSIDGFLSSHIGDGPNVAKSPIQEDSFHKINSSTDLALNGRFPHLDGITASHLKSDSESGFDESSSQMSRSGIDDVGPYVGMEASGIVRSPTGDQVSLEQLITELRSVALGWKSFRSVHNCSCATPFDYSMKKFHCWKCGNVFCSGCIARNVCLPGHYHRRPVPVCKPCYKTVVRSSSMEFPLS